jgi:hypothetical protein
VSHPETQQMLGAVDQFVRRFVVLSSEAQGVAITLWVAHTWAIDAATCTPYLNVLAPEKACGKSRVLEVVGAVCARPWHVTGPSETVLFRKLERDKPTALIDEVGALFSSASERTEPIRAMLNAGNRRGVSVPRCVGPNFELKDFSVFGAKALAGIDNGSLPDTIRDRSLPIVMRRRRGARPVDASRGLRRADDHPRPRHPLHDLQVRRPQARRPEAEPR